MKDDEDDIILFTRPPAECTVFVSNFAYTLIPLVNEDGTVSEVLNSTKIESSLHQLFNAFGLIESIRAFEGHYGVFAVVTFFSRRAAKNAVLCLDGVSVTNEKLRVRHPDPNKERRPPHLLNNQLGFSKIIQLINYYIGYQNWSSEVVSVEEVKDENKKKDGSPPICYEARVALTLLTEPNFTIIASGRSELHGEEKGSIFAMKKMATTAALKIAWESVAVMVNNNEEILVFPIPQLQENTTLVSYSEDIGREI